MLKQLWASRRNVAGAALQWSGLGRAYETACRPEGAIVLMYHSISTGNADAHIDPPNRLPLAVFERQMKFLSAHRKVLSLSSLVEQIESGRSPTAGSVCITFDDGYLDNLTVAAPILARYRLPATLFLATGYVGRAETQWADTLHSLLMRRTRQILDLPGFGMSSANLLISQQLAKVKWSLHSLLLEAQYAQRAQLLREIERQLKPTGSMPQVTMNWDDARQLQRSHPLFEFGGHTRDHVDLRSHTGQIAGHEIRGCAADIRNELSVGPQHFSFPYGRWCDSTRDQVSAAGWRSAVGAGNRMRIDRDSDRFAIPRVEAPRNMTAFRFQTGGAFPGALRMVGLR